MGAPRRPAPQGSAGEKRRRKLAQAVERLLLSRLGGRELSVDEVAVLFQVSRTTLNQALQCEFGRSYVAHLRHLRLLQVRLALAQDPEGAVLAQLARAAGFEQLGRFSRYYLAAFGRLPSEEQVAFTRLAVERDQMPDAISVADPFAGYRRRGRPPQQRAAEAGAG